MEINENEVLLKEVRTDNDFNQEDEDDLTSDVAELISEAGDLLQITTKDADNDIDEKSTKLKNYMSERLMTPLQEKMNAWTILPNVFYCIYFLLSGQWLSEESVDMAQLDMMGYVHMQEEGDFRQWAVDMNEANDYSLLSMFGLEGKCISNSYFPNMHAFPPLPLLAIALAITLHAPFSFLYHYNCATILPPDTSRIEHWSRRMDHAMIHVASALLSYGTSGRWDYFILNAIYNLDCFYRQFKPVVNPKLNKIRIFISISCYTLPILRWSFATFMQCWFIIGLSIWLFAKYPIGGWSHSAFHIGMTFLPPIVFGYATSLPGCLNQIQTAARCAVIHSSV